MAQISKRTTAAGEVRYDVRTRIGGRVVTRTFKRRKDAEAWAATTEADKLRGVAVDPRLARITVREYAQQWLAGRHDLAERTSELYRWVLRRKIYPKLGDVPIGKLSPSAVRTWHADLAAATPATAAKAYRLLSSIMKTAIGDELITRNPCQVKGAGSEKAAERTVVTVAELAALAEAMPQDLRLLVLLAAWCQLRRAEIFGLRRQDVDLLHGTIAVELTRTRKMSGKLITKGPKGEAGRRTVAVPAHVLDALRIHLDERVPPEPGARLFQPTQRGPDVAWHAARASIGRPDLRLHDLRHTGLTLAEVSDVADDASLDLVRDHRRPGTLCPLCGCAVAVSA